MQSLEHIWHVLASILKEKNKKFAKPKRGPGTFGKKKKTK